MTEPKDRPLVTFALFAYNQENYIREAVEGAFSQTYEPLEIILSDDCSTDRTFEIMKKMATAYVGPHVVRTVRNPQNMGVIHHVLARGREAKGEIVIVAAGDDVSKPERTLRLIEHYSVNNHSLALTTGFDVIDSNGNIIARNRTDPIKNADKIRSYLTIDKQAYNVIQGSTASYRKDLFSLPTPDRVMEFAEDRLFNFLIYSNGFFVSSIRESLIHYRQHDSALSNKISNETSFQEMEIKSLADARKRVNEIETYLWIADNCSKPDIIDSALIDKSLIETRIVLDWPNMGLLSRIYSIIRTIFVHRCHFLKWQSARLFGKMPHYLPKMAIESLRDRLK